MGWLGSTPIDDLAHPEAAVLALVSSVVKVRHRQGRGLLRECASAAFFRLLILGFFGRRGR